MKKLIATILALVLVFSLSICGVSASAEEEITIEFWTLALRPTFTDYVQGVIDAYEALHPNIKIDWQDLPWDGIQDKFLAQTAGGNPPDIINIWSQLALTYGSNGALLDLEANATEEQKSIYLEAAYDSARLGERSMPSPGMPPPTSPLTIRRCLSRPASPNCPRTLMA